MERLPTISGAGGVVNDYAELAPVQHQRCNEHHGLELGKILHALAAKISLKSSS